MPVRAAKLSAVGVIRKEDRTDQRAKTERPGTGDSLARFARTLPETLFLRPAPRIGFSSLGFENRSYYKDASDVLLSQRLLAAATLPGSLPNTPPIVLFGDRMRLLGRVFSPCRLWFLTCLVFAGLACLSVRADEQELEAKRDFFEKRIRPVLVEHCYSCHSAQAETLQGGLYLDSKPGWEKGGDSGPAMQPGQPADSLLIQALQYDGLEMPPKGRLSAAVVADFEKWIRDGAFDPRITGASKAKSGVDYQKGLAFWAFQRPQWTDPPRTASADSMIDQFVEAKLEEGGLRANAAAEPEVLIRRAYYNLVGLPPTPEQIDDFCSAWNDDSQSAWNTLVESLLASKHYGERWGRHWLDVARYGEDQAHTFKARRYPRGYLYRDWVVAALNDDMPYDRFLMEQIAGDLLPDSKQQHRRAAALGLFALGPVYYAENVEKAKARADEWDDRVDTLMRGVLGLTISCARCHDHKYDPISMQDYYALAGVFANSDYKERPVMPPQVLEQRRLADEEAQRLQIDSERFLADAGRELRPRLVDRLPDILETAYRFHRQQLAKPATNDKERDKQLAKTASDSKLSATVLRRWLELPKAAKTASPEEREMFGRWIALLENKAKPDSEHAAEQESQAARQIGEAMRTRLVPLLAKRSRLVERFGANVAFVKPEDRAHAPPGVIPLGNLFDDAKGTPLDAAVASDKFKTVADNKSLGVHRVDWGVRVEIAPGVKFDFRKLGGDDRRFGAICNDAWDASGGIRTTGKRVDSNIGRVEQGIGMHANALITFDLNEIRQAGLLPQSQRFRFRVDRAGLNDDTVGANSSAHVAVIVSRPHRDKAVTDAILAAYVDGRKLEIATDDFTYYFGGEIPKPLAADGRFVSFDFEIPAEATHLTLVATGAGGPADNSISSDHTVFSGARLEQDPLPAPETAIAESKSKDDETDSDEITLTNAKILSRILDDPGLLGLTAKEAEPLLDAAQSASLAELRAKANTAKQAAEKIVILTAHSLADVGSQDLPVYLQGNPAKHGDMAPRSAPAIFSDGKRRPFFTQQSGRLELAKFIASTDNPLTARVIVNRVWAGHFGKGIVRTRSNFGQLGDRPSHQEVLDNLAVGLMRNGWSLKWLHREILKSRTFQRSSEFQGDAASKDPENRLLWRMNRKRLEIEPWRDTLLAVTGELDRSLGGASKSLTDSNHSRRTLYSFISRHRLDEQLRLFDFPDPNITSAQRTETIVPLQQLFILNSDFMMQRAKSLANRIQKAGHQDDSQRVGLAYALLFGRKPSQAETATAVAFLAGEPASDEGAASDQIVSTSKKDELDRWQQYCLALLSTNELMYLD